MHVLIQFKLDFLVWWKMIKRNVYNLSIWKKECYFLCNSLKIGLIFPDRGVIQYMLQPRLKFQKVYLPSEQKLQAFRVWKINFALVFSEMCIYEKKVYISAISNDEFAQTISSCIHPCIRPFSDFCFDKYCFSVIIFFSIEMLMCWNEQWWRVKQLEILWKRHLVLLVSTRFLYFSFYRYTYLYLNTIVCIYHSGETDPDTVCCCIHISDACWWYWWCNNNEWWCYNTQDVRGWAPCCKGGGIETLLSSLLLFTYIIIGSSLCLSCVFSTNFWHLQVLVELAELQDREVGDGTTSVVIIAAELLKVTFS